MKKKLNKLVLEVSDVNTLSMGTSLVQKKKLLESNNKLGLAILKGQAALQEAKTVLNCFKARRGKQ